MKVVRKLLTVLLLISGAAALFASGKPDISSFSLKGLSKGAATAIILREEPINYDQVIKTTYFDIIYPVQSERTARVLALRVDALYEKAAALFETEPWFRNFPIIIQPNTQSFNAAYTSVPYKHIFIFDTPNTISMLTTMEETIVNTFYHELIHAVSLNIHKNSFWDRDWFFGDFYNLAYILNSKLFTIEGATVSLESADGEGRIHNGLAMSVPIQAKLEGKFPDWDDIAGPRDIYPRGTASYLFGGSFNWWLEQEFGMSKYADFWKECSTISFTGFSGIFRKIYGISLSDAWEQFEASVPDPETEDEAIRVVLDTDERFDILTSRPGVDTGFVYTKNQYSVRYFDLSDPEGSKDTELFTAFSPEQLTFSADGRYLAVSGFMAGSGAEAYSIRIYDMETGRFLGKELPYCRMGVITDDADGNRYIICHESAAGYAFVSIFDFDDVINATDKAPDPLKRYELELFDEIYATAPVSGGAACLRKADGLWFISVMSPDGSFESWQLPANVLPNSLSSRVEPDGSTSLYTSVSSFAMNAGSETEPGSLTRLGKINIKDGRATLSFQKTAFSGGVYSPAVSARGTVYSIAKQYEWFSLCCFHESETAMTAPVELECTVPVQSTTAQVAYAEHRESEPFKSISYMTRGVLYPFPEFPLSPFSSSAVPANIFGLSWWTANPQNTVNLELSASFPVEENPMAFYASLFGSDTKMVGGTFSWDANTRVTFDGNYLLDQIESHFTMRQDVPLSDYGKQVRLINDFGFYDLSFNAASSVRYAFTDVLSAGIVREKQVGFNPLSVSGFNFGVSFIYEYDISNSYSHDVKSGMYRYNEGTYASPGLFAGFKLARILPLPFTTKFTYNWPLTVQASLFSAPSKLLTASAKVTLFSAEIQKGIPLFPLFCNRFVFDAGYSFANGADTGYAFMPWSLFNMQQICEYFDSYKTESAITASMNFVISPDISCCYSVHFNLGIDGKYYLRNDLSDKQYEITLLGTWKF